MRILISSTAQRRPLPFWHTIMHHHTTPEPQPFAPGTKRAAAVARARNDFHGARSLKTAKWVLRRGGRYQSCPAGAGIVAQTMPRRPRPQHPPAEARPARGGLCRDQANGRGVRRGKWTLGATCAQQRTTKGYGARVMAGRYLSVWDPLPPPPKGALNAPQSPSWGRSQLSASGHLREEANYHCEGPPLRSPPRTLVLP